MGRIRNYITITLLCVASAFSAAPAEAATGAMARQTAIYEQSRHCGTFWWGCIDSTAPKPSCFGRGGGTWECYGGITERHRLTLRWRNCGAYMYMNAGGRAFFSKNC